MSNKCLQCGSDYEITDEDLAFYEKVSPIIGDKKYSIPAPGMCPPCRQQRRLSFRNERKLYTRKSDMSGKNIISIYSPDKPYKVYDQEEWWSDKWDPLEYGRDFDFGRNFADQFRELYQNVPRISLHTINNENSYYTCYTLNLKNCYLIFGAGDCEDCRYGKYVAYCKDSADLLAVYSSEFCYQAVACDGCYGCRFLTNCRNCSDCTMIEDCGGCKNCIACFGLRQKQYCFMNKQLSREEFEKIAKEYEYLTHANIEDLHKKLDQLKADLPHSQSHIYASENCSGDGIYNCKNCLSSFDCKDCEDCKYLHNSPKCLCTYDSVYCAPDGLQFCYNVCSCVGTNLVVCYFVWYCDNVYYSMDCINSRDLLGCVGLKNKQYCIFNKQYSKEKYEALSGRIIEHMKSMGEWGEFFPYKLTPCCYNETVAAEYFPLTKEQALAAGSSWRDPDNDQVNGDDYFVPPNDIRKVDDSICEKVLKCEITGRQYKIVPQELKFYKKMKLPIPRRHSDQRHYDRMKLHDAYQIFAIECDKCGKSIRSIYEKDTEQKIFCEECYLKEVY